MAVPWASLNRALPIAPFEFSLNYTENADLVPLFWAAVNEHVQHMLEDFVLSDNASYERFVDIADMHKLQLLFNCACSSTTWEEERQVASHFKFVMQVLFECAKLHWLGTPLASKSLPRKIRKRPGLAPCMKRQIGGLYLLYYLFTNQPEPPESIVPQIPQKIWIFGMTERKAVIRFFGDLREPDDIEPTAPDGADGGRKVDVDESARGIDKKDRNAAILAFAILQKKGAFAVGNVESSLEANSLQWNHARNNKRLQGVEKLKNIRERFLYMIFQGEGDSTFKDMLKVAYKLWKDKQVQVQNIPRPRPIPRPVAVPVFRNPNIPAKSSETEKSPFKIPKPKVKVKGDFSGNAGSPSQSGSVPRSSKSSKEIPLPVLKFPPEPKEVWTIQDLRNLRKERDLAVIAFRVVEILNFMTPRNPLTPDNLLDEPPPNKDHFLNEKIRHYERDAREKHMQKESCPSRIKERLKAWLREQDEKDKDWKIFVQSDSDSEDDEDDDSKWGNKKKEDEEEEEDIKPAGVPNSNIPQHRSNKNGPAAEAIFTDEFPYPVEKKLKELNLNLKDPLDLSGFVPPPTPEVVQIPRSSNITTITSPAKRQIGSGICSNINLPGGGGGTFSREFRMVVPPAPMPRKKVKDVKVSEIQSTSEGEFCNMPTLTPISPMPMQVQTHHLREPGSCPDDYDFSYSYSDDDGDNAMPNISDEIQEAPQMVSPIFSIPSTSPMKKRSQSSNSKATRALRFE